MRRDDHRTRHHRTGQGGIANGPEPIVKARLFLALAVNLLSALLAVCVTYALLTTFVSSLARATLAFAIVSLHIPILVVAVRDLLQIAILVTHSGHHALGQAVQQAFIWGAAHRASGQPPASVAMPAGDIIRAKEAAEAANTAKSRYLANVCHEMRSPLNAVYGYAQLLERGDDVDRVRAAQVICRSAEHLSSLVDGLLDIAQVEHGVLRVSSDTVHLAPFLDHLVDMFRNEAEMKGLRFVYDRPEWLPDQVRMDEKRLRQILINLLSNAIKFTAAGEVRLRIRYAGQIARFEVSDTGPGIAAEDQARILLPFERGADPVSAGLPGAGLGLAISNALAQILGGALSVESEPGAGSTFRLTMMLGQVMADPPDMGPQGAIDRVGGEAHLVLLVDDDAEHCAISRSLLESVGLAVVEARDGESAVALAMARPPALAIVDINMPGISGWETARRLRAACAQSLKIVMLSGTIAVPDRQSGDGPALQDLVLAKPVKLNDLVDAVGTLLGLSSIMALATAAAGMAGSSRDAGILPGPARVHLSEIRRLLQCGHVRGLEKEIKALATAVPEADGLTRRLFGCLDRFDLAAMRRLVEVAAS